MYVEAMVLKFTFITPTGIQTAGPCQLTQGEEVVRPALEVVETYVQTVVQEVAFDACSEAFGGLPLQLSVTNVTDDNTSSVAVEHKT